MAGEIIKVGDLVKRKNVWSEWTKHNRWMTVPEDQEIGLIIEFAEDARQPIALVQWPNSGYNYEEIEDIELLNSRSF